MTYIAYKRNAGQASQMIKFYQEDDRERGQGQVQGQFQGESREPHTFTWKLFSKTIPALEQLRKDGKLQKMPKRMAILVGQIG